MCSKSKRALDRTSLGRAPDAVTQAASDRPVQSPPAEERHSAIAACEADPEQCALPVEPEHLELNIEVTRLDIVPEPERSDRDLARAGSSC